MHREDPHRRVREEVARLLEIRGADERLLDELPKRWERFADVALLQRGAFSSDLWAEHIGAELWNAIARGLSVQRLGIIGEIIGERRESSVELLLGNEDWVVRRENGVDFGYKFTKCMFSAGNVNERRRMGEVGKSGETVLDLFCGIGYYTLPMLIHSKVEHIHSCEWNPNAIEALEWNLKHNNVVNRCTIHPGDNRVTAPNLQGIADRVILGLLPSAEEGFSLAVDCLKKSGGVLHIHGVAPAKNHDSWIDETIASISEISKNFVVKDAARVRVKSYAPHWDHIVLDLDLRPRA